MKAVGKFTYVVRMLTLSVMLVFGLGVSAAAKGIYYEEEQTPVMNQENSEPAEEETETVLKYRVCQGNTWTKYRSSGSTASKVSDARSIKNLDVTVTSLYSGKVQFKTYTQNSWSDYTDTTDTSVTKGNIQAIRIRLTGQLKEQYDIYYQVHVTDGWWLSWALNGKTAGSIDSHQRINAIRVALVEKGGKAPGETDNPCVKAPTLRYRSAMTGKKLSDAAYKSTGKVSGSKKNKNGITGIQIKLSDKMLPGSIQYRVATESASYGDWVSAGHLAGKQSSKSNIARLQIALTGQLSKAYDIYYRVRINRYGWLDWAKNGESAGSEGLGLYITAYQIKLVKKAQDCKLSTKAGYLVADRQEYVIKVNKKMNCITVYLHEKPIKAFVCSTGEDTPTGTFHTMVKYRWKELIHEVWGQYCTRIVGHILFHSVPYNECDNKTLCTGSYRKLGTTASAGCIRLTCIDAKWIYDNCKLKTKVVIYNSNDPGPLGKPKAPYLPKGQTWDPTDPAFS